MIQLRQTQDFSKKNSTTSCMKMANSDRLTSAYNRYFSTEQTPKLIQQILPCADVRSA